MSFDFDFDAVMTNASAVFNGLMPIFAWPIGITLGLGLIAYVVDAIRSAIRR
jgi:hypothetical protein